MRWRSAVAAVVAADAVVAVVDVRPDIDRRRLHAAADTDRPCRGRNPNQVVQARQERIAPAVRVVRRARPRGTDNRAE
jgi:hypothetical protein